MRKNSKKGAVEVFITADLCNSLIVALESFIVADSGNKYAVYAQRIKDKILNYGRCFMNGDEENVAIYFYENEAALLQQFHFRLIVSAFRKPMVNIFSCNSQKSRFNKLIESFRRTCFPFA